MKQPCTLDENDAIYRFDCSLEEFDALPVEQRLRWMRQFMRQIPHAANWFNNIAGILEGFKDYCLAEPGSWLSIVDAGILQGIQDGYAQSAGLVPRYSFNPGAALWRNFFEALARPAEEVTLIGLWGAAESAATNYGVQVAAGKGLAPGPHEWLFWKTGDLYRWAIASFDGRPGKTSSWIGAGLGLLTSAADGFSLPALLPLLNQGQSSETAGFGQGAFFIDPRSLWNGRSPVYWYSTRLIWAGLGASQCS